jgi:hypothetical protein
MNPLPRWVARGLSVCFGRAGGTRRRPPAPRARPTFDVLEGRDVPSISHVTPEIHVNTDPTAHQLKSSIAMDADGNYVVAWMYQNSYAGSRGFDIHAQRFDATGARLGDTIVVSADSPHYNNEAPSVAMDAQGNFAVAWTGPRPTSPPSWPTPRSSSAGSTPPAAHWGGR